MSREAAKPTADLRTGAGRAGPLVSFLLPALAVSVLLLLLIAMQSQAQLAAASLAGLLPVGYGFAAGMVASVNPCGFILLPSYISYHLGTEEAGYYETSPWSRGARALLLGAAATAGFIVVFVSIGALVAVGGQWVPAFFPYAGVAIGLAMVGLGLWLLISHQTIGIMAAGRVVVSPERNLRNVFLFGIGYALGSLSCTLPVFLVVVGSALVSRGLVTSLTQFVAYSLGMGTILVAVTIGAALFRGVVGRFLRTLIPHVHRMNAFFLIGAGLYLLYYWGIYGRFFF